MERRETMLNGGGIEMGDDDGGLKEVIDNREREREEGIEFNARERTGERGDAKRGE